MEQKVCLDTDVVIAILNNEERAVETIKKIEAFTVCITTITLFELLLRKTHLDVIEKFRNSVFILDFEEDAARQASMFFKDLQSKGKIIEIRDIFIAAICSKSNCALVTYNKKHFEHIKELRLV